MEPSFNSNTHTYTDIYIYMCVCVCMYMAPDTRKEAVRSYWCPKYNLFSFIILALINLALGQVGELMYLYS